MKRTKAQWRTFLGIIKKFPEASAPTLAEVLAPLAGIPKQPSGIISFNAEPLLFALINAHVSLGRNPPRDQKTMVLDRMAHELASGHRRPYPLLFRPWAGAGA